MASIVLNTNLGNPTATFPNSLILSLTGAGVDVQSFGTGVKYLAFDALPAAQLTGTTVFLLAFPDNSFRVDTAYDGKTFAIVNSDNTSSLFTCATATDVQTLTNNGYDTLIPEKQRLWNLTND